ncbi:MAG: peptidylprolyl isomerase [Pseudomonadota bacterium]
MALTVGLTNLANAAPFLLIELKSGTVKVEMLPDIAPKHVAQISALAKQGAYDGIAFHRVIDRFMAQTGDVEYGKVQNDGSVSRRAGTGDSDLPNIPAEFSDIPFDRGIVGMARTNDPNSANSQFFIMFDREPYGANLDGKYTVWGRVVEGIEHVDNIQMGEPPAQPDRMIKVTVVDE